MKKLITIIFLASSALVQAKDIAITEHEPNWITVLTNEVCSYDSNLSVAYIYKPNRDILYSCWKIVGNNVKFEYSVKAMPLIPVNQFIKAPDVKSKKKFL